MAKTQAGAGSMIELMKFDMGGSACTLGAAKVTMTIHMRCVTYLRMHGIDPSRSCVSNVAIQEKRRLELRGPIGVISAAV